ncbi:MAG: glycosyltransferase [Kiritimatiellae bacterium]|nr:glycosyltransferase [Kiritimatiellia bacterium]
MTAIHQLLAGFSRGDAISNEALVLRKVFRSWGFASEIYSEPRRILPELRKEALDVEACRAACRPDDVALLHLSIGSVVNEVFPALPCRKAILYHNITPPEFVQGLQPQLAAHLARGREQLTRLAGTAEVVMADSAFNAQELRGLGYGEVRVLPLVLDLDALRGKSDRALLRRFDDGLVNVLFVGRCVPNKRIEDLLSAFHYFQKFVEPRSRFIHAGSYAGTEQYHALLLTQARELELENVELLGSIRQAELNAAYASADLFLCMSEHEGFCIPLIESMVHDVPVMAYAAGAVPETLDGAGILFREKRFDLVAEMMGRLGADAALRSGVVGGQRARLARYEQRDLGRELREHLAALMG